MKLAILMPNIDAVLYTAVFLSRKYILSQKSQSKYVQRMDYKKLIIVGFHYVLHASLPSPGACYHNFIMNPHFTCLSALDDVGVPPTQVVTYLLPFLH